jgi:hypothetical protein
MGKRILIFLVIIIVAIPSCKKYKDGPLICFQSKEKRVVGDWGTEYFSINGYDSTSALKANLAYGQFHFEKRAKGENYTRFEYGSNANDPNVSFYRVYYGSSGYWMFLNNKKDLYIHQFSETPSVQFNMGAYTANDVVWEIRRLTDAELWLKTTYNNTEYFLKLNHSK